MGFLRHGAVISPTGYWSVEGYSPEEIDLLASQEDVLHLDDLILRRTMIGKLGLLTRDVLDELAGVVAQSIGWSKSSIAFLRIARPGLCLRSARISRCPRARFTAFSPAWHRPSIRFIT